MLGRWELWVVPNESNSDANGNDDDNDDDDSSSVILAEAKDNVFFPSSQSEGADGNSGKLKDRESSLEEDSLENGWCIGIVFYNR
jgi:hypothetical protein